MIGYIFNNWLKNLKIFEKKFIQRHKYPQTQLTQIRLITRTSMTKTDTKKNNNKNSSEFIIIIFLLFLIFYINFIIYFNLI